MIIPVKRTPGVITGVNSESLPPGALKQAANLILRRPDLLEPRRSLRQLVSTVYPPMNPATSILSLFCHQRTAQLYAVASDSTAWRTNGGSANWANVTGSLAPPADYLRTAEMNRNLYAAGLSGVQRICGDTSNLESAGVQRGADLLLSATGSGALLTAGQSVAYRWTWGKKDANGNVVVGEPGGWSLFTAAGTTNVLVKAYLNGVDATYFFQLWRTATFATGITPDDEMQLVFQGTPTATDVANGYISFTDAQPDNLRGAALYTSPSQAGIGIGSNMRPPVCADIAEHRGAMFFADLSKNTDNGKLRVAMLGIPTVYVLNGAGGQVQAATPLAGQATYIFTSATTYDFTGIDTTLKLAVQGCTNAGNNGNFAIVSVDSANRKIVVTNGGAVNEAAPPATAKAVAAQIYIDNGGSPNKYDAAWTEDTTNKRWLVTDSGTVAQQIDATARSICRVMGPTQACYASGPADAPGSIEFRGTVSYIVTGKGNPGAIASGPGTQFSTKWAPDLTGGTAVLLADGDAADLAWSKYQQPEHVPPVNRLRIGTSGRKVSRIVPLRDSMLLFKDGDGLHRITGDGKNFISTPVDTTLLLTNPNLVCTMHNEAYAWTSRGIVKINDAGIVPLSNGIGNLLQVALEGILVSCHAEANDQDSIVYFYMRYYISGFDTNYALQLIYNAKTGAWTGCNLTSLTDISTTDPSLLSLPGVPLRLPNGGSRLFRHDTSTSARDTYAEKYQIAQTAAAKAAENGMPIPGDEYVVKCAGWTGVAGSGGVFTLGTSQNGRLVAQVGDAIAGLGFYPFYFKVTAVNGSALTLAPLLVDPLDAATAGFVNTSLYTLLRGPPQTIQYHSLTLGQPYQPKDFERFALLLEENSNADTVTFGFTTEADAASEGATSSAPATLTVETDIPSAKRRCNRLNAIITHSDPLKYFVVEGFSIEIADVDEPGRSAS